MNKFITTQHSNIREAIKKIDENGEGYIFVTDEQENITGVLTDGDFRRAILNGISLSEPCSKIANYYFKFIDITQFSEREVINMFLQYKIDHHILLIYLN